MDSETGMVLCLEFIHSWGLVNNYTMAVRDFADTYT